MPTKYSLILTTDTGSILTEILPPIYSGFRATRKVNTISPFYVELPYDFLDRQLFTVAHPREYMVQVWRKPGGGHPQLFRTYLITRWERHAKPTPHGKIILRGFDMNLLLYRRIVAGYAASAQARLTDYADDMMKVLLTNALSDADAPTPTAGTRAWGNLSIAAETGSGPSLTLDVPFEKLLTFSGGGAFKKIVNASREAGTDLFFEVQVNERDQNSINFIFNTFTGQIGQDLTDSVRFSITNNTIIDAIEVYDYSQSANYVYAGGEGKEAERTIIQSYDASDYLRGVYTRSEMFLDVPGTDDASLQNEADAALFEARRKIQVKGSVAQTEQLIFGRDYQFGDLVTARVFGDEYDAMVESVTVGMEDGADIVEIGLDYRL